MKAWMIVLYIAAVGFAIAGFYVMFYYDADDMSTKIVGGDAYNYIIIGVRGVGIICVGIISALIATGMAIYDSKSGEHTANTYEAPKPNVKLGEVSDYKMKNVD
ncbi:hypothetical protein M6D81_11280 [Paenibacillus sp. J5C_2022]|uniref:hypothetical protein n=1 Tax=Paenibacillus sp. J5C2022 TaxID=2977129 RepID=UPI0021D2A4D4|nr:hypothetical protein [Paenibacillus sp. J5C2022]MCU6709288.1 hypothetical protein [Paenibacillus sp. J5C2022]